MSCRCSNKAIQGKETMKVNNIKCSFQSSKPIFDGELKRNKKFKSRFGNTSLTIYAHSPLLINLTGLKTIEEIQSVRKYIELVFDVKCSDVRIDNIFYSHKDCCKIDMNALYYHLRDKFKDKYVIDYNVELFPGLYMKSKVRGLPTIIFFRTGSYTIMGSKSIEILIKYKTFVINILELFAK